MENFNTMTFKFQAAIQNNQNSGQQREGNEKQREDIGRVLI
jgi:hypothetical protein